RLEHGVLGQLAGEPLDHRDLGPGAGDDQVEVTLLELRVGREGDELAVDPADTDGPDRVQQRDVGDVYRGAGADHGQHVRVVVPVGRQDRGDDLHLVDVPGREQRPQRPVDEAGG